MREDHSTPSAAAANDTSLHGTMERFQLFMEAAPYAAIIVDRRGRIAAVNRRAEQLFGYTRAELLGQPVEMLVPRRFHAAHAAQVQGFFDNPIARPIGAGRDLFGQRKDGSEVPIEIGLNAIGSPEGSYTLASIIDITERKNAEDRFRLVVEAAPNAMVMVDRERRISMVNQRAEELFGYRREELIGREVELLVPDAFRAKHPGYVRAFLQRPAMRAIGAGRDLFGQRKNGSQVPIEIGLNPIHTPQGMHVLASIIDITERKRYLDELRRSNAELEQFAYVTSHDLVEPLRMVSSYLQLLGQRYKGKLDDKADKYIDYAVAGARRMHLLINDLLAYSRVGSSPKPGKPVDPTAVLNAVKVLFDAQLRQSEGELSWNELPVVNGDEIQLGQLFQNLIGNALKFRSERAPLIHVDAARRPDGWLFSVRDNGIGIDQQHAERVFQIFQRLHERDKYEGSGIGLAIAKRIVERHGGRIWFESQIAVGTTFFFTLPA